MKKSILLMSTLLCLSLTACSEKNGSNETKKSFDNTTTKTIETGKIKGNKDKENNALEWLGVPYAKSPEGDLRWKSPVKPNKWKKTLDATKYGNKAIQFSNGKVEGSEDSLNLDVVRPDSNESNLPIMVYIHGGNNQTGTSQEIKGNTFVNDIDAVYVSVNYRLGALGYNPLTALKHGSEEENSGNFGLLDIALALDWVEENAEAFGGDAKNITLTGFSAGGRDVMASLISPQFKGKYQKAISFSGGMTLADSKNSQEIFAKAIAPLVVEDKVKTSVEDAEKWLLEDTKEVSDYLYNLPAERLAPLMGNAGIRMSVFPHLYKDGNVIPSTGFEGAEYNDVPLMLLTGTNEFSLFSAFDKKFTADFTSGELFKNPEKMKEFNYARQYGGQLYRLSNGVDSARVMQDTYKSKIYIGEIGYGDSEKVTPELAKTLGAFHGIFEPMLQKPSNYKDFIGKSFETDGAKEMSSTFKAYLKNFLYSGNPNKDKLPEWKNWSNENSVLKIDASKNKAKIETKKDSKTAQDVIKKMDEDTSLSEEKKSEINKTVLNGRWFSGPLDGE
ncbi:carboxylesterase [Streptococcus bovimastitidis]|uniref:Carboxylic ester hydrolase n=1 Tax=Streptococcus bovimastitidis TaxID=1856638 RepID=A0A1L8MP89_9STRE|nr:carboxylesterase family protein [Streptococcus bovimastitidis]OJF72549.1 carboxylesterase [Streptococcus bovimastitidis]